MDSAVTGQLQNVVSDLTNAFKSLATQVQSLGNSLQRLATAGISATAEGNRLSFMWLMFSRQIAGIFLPVVNLAINALSTLTQWFKSLTGEGQSIAMSISLVAVGMKVLLPIFNLLKGVFSPVALALGLLLEALMQFFQGTAEGQMIMDGLAVVAEFFMKVFAAMGEVFKVVVDALVVGFQLIVRGLSWLFLKIVEIVESIISWIPGLEDWAESIKKFREDVQRNVDAMFERPLGADPKVNKEKKRSDVNPSGFGFESLSASFERITSAANKTDLAREQLDVQKKQLAKQDLMIAGIEGVKLAVVGVGGHGGGDF